MHSTSQYLEIRSATKDDLAFAKVIYDLAFAPLYAVYRFTGETATRQQARFNEGTRLVALIDNTLLGTIQFRLDTKHIHLLGLAVHPDRRGRGIARALVESAVERAPSLGHSVIVLDTIEETGNVPIFERMGFTRTKTEIAPECGSDLHSELHLVTMERVISMPTDTD